ncbi:hypothetical protein BHE74_00052765 [Ensete ventricosum]|nr:hypothetical protein BHE74_00052765 [Ensete ventricosum]
MLQRASQYVAAESLVARKQEDHKKPRGDKPQGQPSRTPRRRDRLELPAPRPLPIPLNSIRTEEWPRRDRNPSPRSDRPIEKQIDVIIGGLASGGDSFSARKAYVRSAVEKRPRRSQDPEITFGDEDDAYPDHDVALVTSSQIANARVKRVMVDTGITVREEPRSKTLLVSFIMVALPSAYNAIIGRPMLNKPMVVVSTYHRIMKFSTKARVGEV